MKKIIFAFVSFFAFSLVSVNADQITMEQIIDAFNEGEVAKTYREANGSFNAVSNDDSISIKVELDDVFYDISLGVEGTIIFTTIDKNYIDNSFLSLYMFIGLADEIGILHGYDSGDLSTTLNSSLINDYTLENEGYEVENISENIVTYKLDYTKKIPLADFSNEYLKKEDFEDYKEYIIGDGFASFNKGILYFSKTGYDGETTILIGEKNSLTSSTYKSLVSVVNFIFENNDITEYFKKNFNDINDDKEFEGFSLKVDSNNFDDNDIDNLPLEWEESGYEFVIMRIDKDSVISAVNDNDDNNAQDNFDEDNDVENNNKDFEEIVDNPQTGSVYLFIFFILSVASLSFIIYSFRKLNFI